MTDEPVPRPTCPACGAGWNDEMVERFDLALGFGCSCCNPFAAQLPDIECHRCGKVLYSARGNTQSAAAEDEPLDDLDLTPRA